MLESVTLKNGNLLIPCFALPPSMASSSHALVRYVENRNIIVLADPHHPHFAEHFPGAQQQILKMKNSRGDRAVSCRDIFLDHSLEPFEGELGHRLILKETVLQIDLNDRKP